jgi:signal transduction histidine kinase
LAVSFAVLFAGVVVLIGYSHFQYLQDRREARLEDMQRVSQTVAAYFDGLTKDLESFSLSTTITLGDASIPIDQNQKPETVESVDEYLNHLFESHGLLRAIFITDTNGQVIYENDPTAPTANVSDRPYIQALQAGAPAYWSDGLVGSVTGRMVVAHSRAIVSKQGQTIGYLVIALDTDELASRLPSDLASDGHISIIDGTGQLILSQPSNESTAIGLNVTDWHGFAEARAGTNTLIKDHALPVAASDRYASLIPMQSLGWVVGYTLPSSDIDGASTNLFLRDVFVLGAIVLAAFAITWVFAARMVRPLSKLTEIAQGISRGEPTEDPMSVNAGDADILLLAETMGNMREAIKQREQQLHAQNLALNAVERLGESLASDLDLERSIQAIIDAGVELVHAEAVQFLYSERDSNRLRVAIAGPRPALALTQNDAIVHEVLKGATIGVGTFNPDESPVQSMDPQVHVGSVLGIPIRDRNGTTEGALILASSQQDAYTFQDERLALGLARWASIVLENAQLYSQSQELVGALETSNMAKDEFLGIISHELRTPITTIYGGTLLLRLRRENLPEQAFNDMIVSISEEAERLHHLVEDLLAIARTEIVGDRRPLDVAEVLRIAIADFGTTHRRSVDLEVEPTLPAAIADSTYVRQIVTNLISNADKYTSSDQPLQITATADRDEIYIRVLDNGDGVSDADLPHIFESFFRAKDAAERASGSGLGLTVCKRLVESLGGRIWAKNRPDGGLEVGFTLRREPSPGEQVAGVTSPTVDRAVAAGDGAGSSGNGLSHGNGSPP